jgi:UDP-glucose 4-epimerase
MRSKMFAGQTFLITGGTGSFGKTLVEFLLRTGIAKIVVLSRDEAKQHFMREEFPDSRLRLVLGDIRNEQTVKTVLQGVDFVFHAAALKQVPAGESYPWEFVQTNVVGSQNIISNLEDAGVKKAVFLSTDKAVYPVNAMGISKAMMEKLVRAEYDGATSSPVITRYGNVIGSRGSVIPGFLSSIKDNGSVNITDGNMTRFMMSLKESVDLVLFALENGVSGDLFVQKAPASTVETLVDALEILTKRTIKRNYVGIRPGEKIHESLLTAEERARALETTNYFQVPRLQLQAPRLNSNLQEYSSNTTQILSAAELAEMLHGIPEIRKLVREI